MGDTDSSSSIGSDDVYKGKVESMLVLSELWMIDLVLFCFSFILFWISFSFSLFKHKQRRQNIMS